MQKRLKLKCIRNRLCRSVNYCFIASIVINDQFIWTNKKYSFYVQPSTTSKKARKRNTWTLCRWSNSIFRSLFSCHERSLLQNQSNYQHPKNFWYVWKSIVLSIHIIIILSAFLVEKFIKNIIQTNAFVDFFTSIQIGTNCEAGVTCDVFIVQNDHSYYEWLFE